jgi:hypothetical protein
LHLDSILDLLSHHHQRATYGAVGAVVGLPARSVMARRPRTPRHSYVVSKRTGLPTGYSGREIDDNLHARAGVLRDEASLHAWLRNPR